MRISDWSSDVALPICLALDGDGQLRILAPADMVLHAAVHLFNDGEYDHGLRALLDIGDLLQHFGEQPAFWGDLAMRAEALGLTGPLQLTLRYLERLPGMPLPAEIPDATAPWQRPGERRGGE